MYTDIHCWCVAKDSFIMVMLYFFLQQMKYGFQDEYIGIVHFYGRRIFFYIHYSFLVVIICDGSNGSSAPLFLALIIFIMSILIVLLLVVMIFLFLILHQQYVLFVNIFFSSTQTIFDIIEYDFVSTTTTTTTNLCDASNATRFVATHSGTYLHLHSRTNEIKTTAFLLLLLLLFFLFFWWEVLIIGNNNNNNNFFWACQW